MAQRAIWCAKGTMPAHLLYRQLADEVADIILGSLQIKRRSKHRTSSGIRTIQSAPPERPFNTSKTTRFWPRPDKSHINWIITDSSWEDQFAAVIEEHPRVCAYAKNHNLGFEVPYMMDGEARTYLPDFLIRLDTEEPTTLIVEIKGYRGHDAMLTADTMRNKWIPAINRHGKYGKWGLQNCARSKILLQHSIRYSKIIKRAIKCQTKNTD